MSILKYNKYFLYNSLFWTGLILLSANGYYNRGILNNAEITYLHAIKSYISQYIPWMIITPFVFILTRKFTFGKSNNIKAVLVHLVSGLGFMVVFILLSNLLTFGQESILDEIRKNFPSLIYSLIPGQMTLYSLVVLGSHALDYFLSSKESELTMLKMKEEIANIRLESLKYQIQPHFLFNTLHTIAGLARKNKNKETVDMIVSLSGFLRTVLDKSESATVSLEEEIEFCTKYLDIEKVRFEDRLTTKINIEDGVKSAEIPFLILQPLLENSIKHSLSKITTKCEILIEAKKMDGKIKIVVQDSGTGTHDNAEWVWGIGLNNIKSRLDMLYKKEYKFDIKQENQISGPRIEIVIPYKDQKNEN